MALLRTARLYLSTIPASLDEERGPEPPPDTPTGRAWGPRYVIYEAPAGQKAILRSMTAVYLGSLSINPLPGLVMDVSPWAGAYQAFYYWVFGGQETGFMSTSASMWWDGQLVLNPGERLYAAATGGPVALQGSGAVMPVLS